MPATVAELIAYLQGFPAALPVMLEAHPGGLIPIQAVEVLPVVLGYFATPRKMPGAPKPELATMDGWGPHCPVSYAREYPRSADVPVLVLSRSRPGNTLAPSKRSVTDPAAVEADMRCFLNAPD